MRAAGVDMTELTEANRAAAAVVAPAAGQRAPVRTGALAASMRPTATRAAARVASRLPYAGAIHWGWPAHNIAPNPFASEAATDTEPTWTPIYERRIDQILSKIKGV